MNDGIKCNITMQQVIHGTANRHVDFTLQGLCRNSLGGGNTFGYGDASLHHLGQGFTLAQCRPK